MIFFISLIKINKNYNHFSSTFQSILRFLYSKSPNSRPGNSLSELVMNKTLQGLGGDFIYWSRLVSIKMPRTAKIKYLTWGKSFIMIVIRPRWGVFLIQIIHELKITIKNYPLTRPTISPFSSHFWPRLYKPRSWTSLLSPFVKILNCPFGALKCQIG